MPIFQKLQEPDKGFPGKIKKTWYVSYDEYSEQFILHFTAHKDSVTVLPVHGN